jgi:23S rRNA (adenine2503-C2)-methyltransferase
MASWGWPTFRADQIRRWVYDNLVTDTGQMTNLSKMDRQYITDRIELSVAAIAANQTSSDGTQKLLLRWPDGSVAESVMIPDGDRRTACVSSQVGCPVGCKFCASGMEGLKNNLSAAQIVEQIFMLNLQLAKAKQRITNIVFMGMGEPLANYASVLKAIRILHDPKCFNIGGRKITVSTVGLPPRMKQLAGEDLPLNLAISLHAPNDKLRQELIPWAQHFSIAEIMDAARFYFDQTGREVTLEYILLSGVNDQTPHALELARLCKGMRVNINLIRYNPVATLPYGRPKSEAVMNFQTLLRQRGLNPHVRKSRGRDIDAACGQLRRKQSAESLPVIEV